MERCLFLHVAAQSPNSPNQPGNGKGRVWSSRDIIGGKVDVSHVVSRYKEGLLAPVLVAKAKQRVGSMALPEQVRRRAFMIAVVEDRCGG